MAGILERNGRLAASFVMHIARTTLVQYSRVNGESPPERDAVRKRSAASEKIDVVGCRN